MQQGPQKRGYLGHPWMVSAPSRKMQTGHSHACVRSCGSAGSTLRVACVDMRVHEQEASVMAWSRNGQGWQSLQCSELGIWGRPVLQVDWNQTYHIIAACSIEPMAPIVVSHHAKVGQSATCCFHFLALCHILSPNKPRTSIPSIVRFSNQACWHQEALN